MKLPAGGKCGILFSVLAVTILAVVIVVSIVVVLTIPKDSNEDEETVYLNGAVAADNGQCSDIGVSTLKKGGSAVDAAIATLFCIGVTNVHSSGIGGGLFMVVYINKTRSSWFYNGREKAPNNASRDMFVNTTDSKQGPRAVGVPGEVKAMYSAWRAHGKLPWKQLVQPAIDICQNGFSIHRPLYLAMKSKEKILYDDPGFRKLLFKRNTTTMFGLGDKLLNPELGKTLETIARNPMSFYNGTIAALIAKDMQRLGGIITVEDLKNYTVVPKRALAVNLDDNYRMVTSHPPSSGAVLAMILNILKGYKFFPRDKSGEKNATLTYHRIIEAFKFAYAYRALLGDPEYESGISKLVENMTSDVFTERLRLKISDNMTHNVSYYGGFYSNWEDKGTTHLSVLSKNGDAVALTATINTYFGSKVRSPSLGIIYNNEMDDFSTPGLVNVFGVEPSPRNYIKPGKRMMSSMSPTIFVDKSGRVRLAVGASGGTRITTAVAQVVANYLWFGNTLKESIESPRLHHQLVPTYTRVEKNVLYRMKQPMLDNLARFGHTFQFKSTNGVVQAVAVDEKGRIHAESDPRKFGRAAGY